MAQIVKNPDYTLLSFPGGPMFKTLCFQHREHGFDPWSGN